MKILIILLAGVILTRAQDSPSNLIKTPCNTLVVPVCPQNQYFDYNLCQCVCASSKNCLYPGQLNSQSCICDCPWWSYLLCQKNQFLNSKNCQCECKEPCKDCSRPQIWNENVCNCVCPYRKKCLKNQFWSEWSCNCECKQKPRKCCEKKLWSQKVCDCTCQYPVSCIYGYEWDSFNCKCMKTYLWWQWEQEQKITEDPLIPFIDQANQMAEEIQNFIDSLSSQNVDRVCLENVLRAAETTKQSADLTSQNFRELATIKNPIELVDSVRSSIDEVKALLAACPGLTTTTTSDFTTIESMSTTTDVTTLETLVPGNNQQLIDKLKSIQAGLRAAPLNSPRCLWQIESEITSILNSNSYPADLDRMVFNIEYKLQQCQDFITTTELETTFEPLPIIESTTLIETTEIFTTIDPWAPEVSTEPTTVNPNLAYLPQLEALLSSWTSLKNSMARLTTPCFDSPRSDADSYVSTGQTIKDTIETVDLTNIQLYLQSSSSLSVAQADYEACANPPTTTTMAPFDRIANMIIALQDLQSAIQNQINSNAGNVPCYITAQASTEEALTIAQDIQSTGTTYNQVEDNVFADLVQDSVSDVYQQYINCGAAVQPTTVDPTDPIMIDLDTALTTINDLISLLLPRAGDPCIDALLNPNSTLILNDATNARETYLYGYSTRAMIEVVLPQIQADTATLYTAYYACP